MTSVCQSRIGHLLHIAVVAMHACLSHALAPFDEDQERQYLCQARECCNDEGVLVAHIRDPWGKPGVLH